MIKYEWRTSLDDAESAELRDLLTRAAAYDAEPEYNSIDFDDVVASMANSGTRHLVIWMLPRPHALDEPPEPQRIAGLIRFVDGDDGWADGTVVIEPDLRSIGIMTLLIEQVGLDVSAAEGWLGSGIHKIRAWARGNHPASGRITDRNLVPRTQQIWKLIREIERADNAPDVRNLAAAHKTAAVSFLDDITRTGAAQTPAIDRARRDIAASDSDERPVLGLFSGDRIDGLVGLDLTPVPSEEFGRCGSIRYLLTRNGTRDEMKSLILGTTAPLRAAGLEAVIVYVESVADELVAVCRLTGFQHDRTDIRYELS